MNVRTARAWLWNGSENFITLSICDIEMSNMNRLAGDIESTRVVRFNGTINSCVVSPILFIETTLFKFYFVLHFLQFLLFAWTLILSKKKLQFVHIHILILLILFFPRLVIHPFLKSFTDILWTYVNDHCILKNNDGFFLVVWFGRSLEHFFWLRS